jgi:hypothetical protein
LPLVHQEELVRADLGGAEPITRLAEVTGEPGDVFDVRACVCGEKRPSEVPHRTKRWCSRHSFENFDVEIRSEITVRLAR